MLITFLSLSNKNYDKSLSFKKLALWIKLINFVNKIVAKRIIDLFLDMYNFFKIDNAFGC